MRCAAVMAWLVLTTTASAQDAPRYLPAIQEELERGGADAACETLAPTLARCRFEHVTSDARRRLRVTVVYSDESDTVYLYVGDVARALPELPSTTAVLRRIAELNWRSLATKLQWDPTTGEVRMSALLHTDSNLDRRALRTLLRLLVAEAERRGPELQRLALREPDPE